MLSRGVHVQLPQDWMKSEQLACLDWLMDTVEEAEGQTRPWGPAIGQASNTVQNVQNQGQTYGKKRQLMQLFFAFLCMMIYAIFAVFSVKKRGF